MGPWLSHRPDLCHLCSMLFLIRDSVACFSWLRDEGAFGRGLEDLDRPLSGPKGGKRSSTINVSSCELLGGEKSMRLIGACRDEE